MLMSVTERYKEIGTMKCLGALDNFIVKLFLIESGLLGFFGALFGSIIGALFIILTRFGDVFSGKFGFDWLRLLMYVGVCIVLGTVLSIIAALGPAMRASKMPPADAMRTEI
jgi:ABC-type lipoprotein release transport system permease subunit